MGESFQAILNSMLAVSWWLWPVAFAMAAAVMAMWHATAVAADGGSDLPRPVFRRLVQFWFWLKPGQDDTWCVRVLMVVAVYLALWSHPQVNVLLALTVLYVGTLYLALYAQFASPSAVKSRQKNWAELRQYRAQAHTGGPHADATPADPADRDDHVLCEAGKGGGDLGGVPTGGRDHPGVPRLVRPAAVPGAGPDGKGDRRDQEGQ